ncbi:DUF6701 domain-containing protein [Shewanella zhangzhouensis]|uniref:DUF6701 domain-containing protein n=1 Tax=Shewanella zhangzhouensis TaxID=2864213 RepID=UPI001C65EEFD|nr:DUF6701 domain-containing protein [Shewanella zhangzhouensis]QYK05732.1 hypothetical protein K0H63_02485 [Shewanella zhangzhouensis]
MPYLRLLLIVLLCWLPQAMAVPVCSDIFTDPPTGNHNPGLLPPPNLETSRGNIECSKHGRASSCTLNNRNFNDSFTPGDYNYSSGSFSHGSYINTNGRTTRLYFDSFDLNQASLNASGRAEDLIIYVRGSFSMAGQNYINAILYVAGSVHITGNASLDGALAAGGSLAIQGNGDVDVDLSVVDNADFGGMCDKQKAIEIDHFLLQYSQSPLTCKAETVTVLACKNGSCSELVTDPVSATLTAANAVTGWEGGNNISLVNGSGQKRLWHTVVAPPVTIGVGSSSPVAVNPTLCQRGSGTPSMAACTFAFADSGFLFDVPDKLAGKAASITLSAVRKDDQSQRCVPTFQNTSKQLAFWSDYLSPDAVALVGSPKMTVESSPIGTSVQNATSIPLNFNSQGEATLSVNYPDAGQLALNARYLGGGSEGNLQLDGSDSFVSFPVGMCVRAKDPLASCPAGDATCAAYRKTGDSFDLLISAHAWSSDTDNEYCDNATTPNFEIQNITLGSTLVAPVGGSDGVVGTGSYSHKAQVDANQISQSINEVGVFLFSAQAPNTYLGSQFYRIPQAQSGNIGRFVPAGFALKDVSLIPACGLLNSPSFSYMGQPTPLSMQLEAHNHQNQVTVNYRDDFAKGKAVLAAENDNDGTDLSARLSALAGAWAAGVMAFDSTSTFIFARTTAPGMDGPFELLDIGLWVNDMDGDLSRLAPLDMKPDSVGDCSVMPDGCSAQRLGTVPMRHGRAVLDNTYGPETDILRMPAYAQYWNGSAWTLSTEDSCSIASVPLSFQVDNPALGYLYQPGLLAGQSIDRSATSASFSQGQLPLFWQALGSPLYRGQVTAPLDVPDWLHWYWNWSGSEPQTLSDPRASAYFGRYRGDDRIIFWREIN